MSHDPQTFKVAFAVTEVGPDVAVGDYFTALELGSALRKLLRWEVVWLPQPQWYDVGDANALIAMTDHYDLTRLGPKAANLVKICWMRNWFDRWAGRPHFSRWDIRLCSSLKAAAHIEKRYGVTPSVLRIAANHKRFRPRPEEKLYDYVFTGSYWNAPRDIELIDPAAIGLRFALFGKNWENHPQFRPYYKGFAPYHAMARIYNQSRLLVDDANSVTKEWGSVNSRVFDALASGTLVVTNSVTASAELFDNRLPVYDSPDSLREVLKRYLDDPSRYQETLEDLRERVLAAHTYDFRARELAKIILAHLQAGQVPSQRDPVPLPRGTVARQRQPLVSIVIPVCNRVHATANCLEALFRTTPDVCEIIVVDNGSTDGTLQLLGQYGGRIRVLRNAQDQGFARACNSGAVAAAAPLLLFLDNDVVVQPDWLPPLLTMAAQPLVGAAGSRLLSSDGAVLHAGMVIVERQGAISLLPRNAFAGETPATAACSKATLVQAVSAACMLVNAADFRDAGGFDTAYGDGCADVDLCFKLARLGRQVVHVPASVVVRHESTSSHDVDRANQTDIARLCSRWEGLVAPDLIDDDENIMTGEGLSRRRDGDSLAPASDYGEALKAWWNRSRTRLIPLSPARIGPIRMAVHICTPSRKNPEGEDTLFGQELAAAFIRLGHEADVLFKDQWQSGRADIAIHIRGVYRHYPQPGTKNILWIISHPELITKEELDNYDLVLCASAPFLRQIELITSTPCHHLPRAANPAFRRDAAPQPERLDLLFVGNNHVYRENRRRQIVQDVLDAGYGAALRVIGRDWTGYLSESNVLEEHTLQEMLPRVYGMARININDQHTAMGRAGFVNNLTYDLGALGLFQISNAVPGIEALGVVTYASPTDLRHKIVYYLDNESARKEIAAYSFERCAGETFDARAKAILELAAR